jgi:DNA-directed RNA polymerase specialized sigma24 family protein
MTAVQGDNAMLDVRPSRAEIEPMALDLIQRRGAEVLSTARRHAVSDEDAEDAYQRGLEILLTKAPSVEEDVIVPWLKVVVKHEAYALARERARAVPTGHGAFDALPGDTGDGDESAERLDRVRVGSEALARLKPQETRCMVLLAQGFSYSQIQSATGFSYTKVNRCLSEGRKAFVARVRGIESGAECERWAPLLSAVADGEASADDMTALRPHLRACAACRATLRDYHDAPRQLTLLLGPIGFATFAGGAGKAAGAGWFSFAALQKAAAGVAATAALAGGGAVAMQEMHSAPPAPSPRSHASTARPHPTTTTASAAPASAGTTVSLRKKHRKRHKPYTPPAPQQPAAQRVVSQPKPPAQNAGPTPSTSKPKPKKHQPPVDPGGEFGP